MNGCRVFKIRLCTHGRFDTIAGKGRKMSEEKGKIRHIVTRIISIFALVIGITIFLGGLLALAATRALWLLRTCDIPIPDAGGDFNFTRDVALFSLICFWDFWPYIIIIGLVLPIVTLFIERNILLRLLPLVFLIVGICFYAICFFIAILFFLGG
jgi:hypothetical protein